MTASSIFKIFLCSLAFFIISGCGRKGCTDNQALNFESNAKKDDNTCQYSTIVFKVDETDFGYDSVTNSWTSIYLDGMSIGSITRTGERVYTMQKGSYKYLAESTVYDDVSNVYLRSDSGYVNASSNDASIEIKLYD